jgi:hypothetical protein
MIQLIRFLFILLFSSIPLLSFCQEILSGLQENPVVKEKAREIQLMKALADGQDTIPVTLPFFDDFRAPTVFPVPDRWIDREAFVNSDIPVFPVNRGAVTLDAISDSGAMYPNAIPGPNTFLADHLTSRFIRLDSVLSPVPKALTPADSVYLSFFYQPQGRGQAPHAADSLLLHFLVREGYDSITPTDTIHIDDLWEEVWGTQGMSLDTFTYRYNRYNVQVMIPVKDPKFFKKKFRFQFYNYVSLASAAEPSWQSNCSQWNLDNIYLNSGRTYTDTIRPEITFVERPPSMLRNYASMPYPQYCNDPTSEMADTIDILISNRTSEEHNSTYDYYMDSPDGSFRKEYHGGEYVIKPLFTNGYVTYAPFAHPPVPYLFPISSADSAQYIIKHVVKSIDGSVLGDSMQTLQRFYNYYAYDDGTPDAGYGLSPSGSRLAYRFRLNQSPDTLRAVQMYFNRTLGENNVQFFYLTVWNDNNNKPGTVIAEQLVLPKFTDSLNKFITYHFNPPVRISGIFYVGWEQTTDDNLNIGFDRYNDSRKHILYNVTDEWINSAFYGSLMIRPIVGKPIPLGVNDRKVRGDLLMIFPNPASGGYVRISLPDHTGTTEDLIVRISDIAGREVFQGKYSDPLNVSRLVPGIYVLTVTGESGSFKGTGRLVIL